MYQLFPTPRHFTVTDELVPTGLPVVCLEPALLDACCAAGYDPQANLAEFLTLPGSGLSVTANLMDGVSGAFEMEIRQDGVHISCTDGAGLYYAVEAIRQLAVQTPGDYLPICTVQDAPALEVRGIMLDIGRDKIPQMKTLYSLIGLFGKMRINHLQLYMEGFCFDYPQYRYLFSDETPITAEEFRQLSAYAKAHFIDLVPNQNVLGHMEKWLERPQFRHLAECEDGYIFNNLFWRPPMTLDVYDPGSIALAGELLDTLLANSDSDYVNLNLDEPFEMGMGKNKAVADRDGRLKLYFDYVDKLNAYCRAKGKKMMMWGDEVLADPANAARLPHDVTLLDWIYEGDAKFEDHARQMQQAGLRYCLCPGSSSWGALTGRNDNMLANIADAAANAVKYGGAGIITTDWGDLGHWQYLSASYPAFVCAALYAWCGTASRDTAEWYCNTFIYQSSDGSAFRTAWDLGNYYKLERAPLYNTTLCFAVMSSKYYFDSIEEFDQKMERLLTLSANIARTNHIPAKPARIEMDYDEMTAYLDRVDAEIHAVKLGCAGNLLLQEEMENGLRMVRYGAKLYHTLKDLHGTTVYRQNMADLADELNAILKVHYKLWCARNRTGGFSRSIAHMQHLIDFCTKQSHEQA